MLAVASEPGKAVAGVGGLQVDALSPSVATVARPAVVHSFKGIV